MATPATGELRKLISGWEARIRIAGKIRESFDLSTVRLDDPEGAKKRCVGLAEIAVRLRRAGRETETVKLLELAAKAKDGRPWDAIIEAVDALCRPNGAEKTTSTNVHTFVSFAEEWTSGKLHARWPDHVPTKDSAEADARMLRLYVEPIVQDTTIQEFSLDHADQIMASLPARLSSSSRRHIAQFVRRVLALAVYPARLRNDSPIPRGWMPKVKCAKAFTHLYPEEDRTLLACSGSPSKPGVPLTHRLFYGILAREGLRRSELAALRWRDLQLEKGCVTLDHNKTDDPRSWALDPGVVRALEAWKTRYCPDAEPEHPVFSEKGCALYVLHLADELRADLKTAGAERESLFERNDARRPIRVHDLRSTFVTVSLANGKTETWVADRTGHRSSEMINRYRRAARTWAELNLGPLSPLDESIPELRTVPNESTPPNSGRNDGTESPATTIAAAAPLPQPVPQALRGIESRAPKNPSHFSGEKGIRTLGTVARTHDFQSERAIEGLREIEKNRVIGDPRCDEMQRDGADLGHSEGQSACLETAILEAARDKQWDVVRMLGRELEARRFAATGNVTTLPRESRERGK